MTVVGRGRIVVWEGASLWVLKGEQEAADLQPHAHHAIQITFQLEGSFEIGVLGECLTGPVAAVCSDTPHSFRASGAVAFIFVAPESSVGRGLGKALFADRPWANVKSGPFASSLEDLRKCFRRAFCRGGTSAHRPANHGSAAESRCISSTRSAGARNDCLCAKEP